jgi:hypothetical protein
MAEPQPVRWSMMATDNGPSHLRSLFNVATPLVGKNLKLFLKKYTLRSYTCKPNNAALSYVAFKSCDPDSCVVSLHRGSAANNESVNCAVFVNS